MRARLRRLRNLRKRVIPQLYRRDLTETYESVSYGLVRSEHECPRTTVSRPASGASPGRPLVAARGARQGDGGDRRDPRYEDLRPAAERQLAGAPRRPAR